MTRDLAPILPKAKIAATVPIDEVLMRVRDASNWRGNSGVRYTMADATADAAGATASITMAYAAEGGVDPYAEFEARIVPENVTLLPKTKEQLTGGNPVGERVHLVKKGDTVVSVLRDQGATTEEAQAIAATLGPRGRDGGLKEGQKLRILMAPAAPGQRLQPYRVIVANDSTIEAVAALSDLGNYVAVDVASMNRPQRSPTTATRRDDDGSGVRLYQSVYETALRDKVPPASSKTWSASTPTTSISSARCSRAILRRLLRRRRRRNADDREERSALCLAHRGRRDQEILSLPDP